MLKQQRIKVNYLVIPLIIDILVDPRVRLMRAHGILRGAERLLMVLKVCKGIVEKYGQAGELLNTCFLFYLFFLF